MRWIRSWCPEEDWLRQQAPTLSINLTKQGYCLFLVPATGVKWSTVCSTIARGRVPPYTLELPIGFLETTFGKAFKV